MTVQHIVMEKIGAYELRRRPDVSAQAVLEALGTPGQILKQSQKAITRKVGAWVIKESSGSARQRAKQVLRPGAFVRAWEAALFFEAHGVGVPRAVALARRRTLGATVSSAMIIEYLDGCCSVEQHAVALVKSGAGPETVQSFLDALARAVTRLCDTGAYHADLSGKNILTRTGAEFHFIDLDGVELGKSYTNALRLKNLVQLYDSFCDLWDDTILAPFIARMLPSAETANKWIEMVQRGQKTRRARTEALWRKQGRV